MPPENVDKINYGNSDVDKINEEKKVTKFTAVIRMTNFNDIVILFELIRNEYTKLKTASFLAAHTLNKIYCTEMFCTTSSVQLDHDQM